MKNATLIIGITGAFGSGKSTATKFFESKGYSQIVLSSFLEMEANKRGNVSITRKLLQDIGNELREKEGKGILAKKALLYVQEKQWKNVIIDGIRNLGEIEELRKSGNFILVGIVADRNVRFARLQKMKGTDAMSQEIFTTLDYRDLGIGETESGLQVAYCLAFADYFIENNNDEQMFIKRLSGLLKKVEEYV